jgi:DNA-binding response OmpR family regulator
MGKRILIAEDDLDSRQLLEDLLKAFRRYDVQVYVARDGEEAVEMAEREHPDLVLLDVMMPGKDGYEVCKAIKENPDLADTYVIMVTSRTSTQDRVQAVIVEADEYLTKPYKVNLILERVQQVLNVVPVSISQ